MKPTCINSDHHGLHMPRLPTIRRSISQHIKLLIAKVLCFDTLLQLFILKVLSKAPRVAPPLGVRSYRQPRSCARCGRASSRVQQEARVQGATLASGVREDNWSEGRLRCRWMNDGGPKE